MWYLMAKFKMEAWQNIEHIDPNDGSEHDIESRKTYLLNEYKMAMGQGYMFKWEWRD